MDALEIEWIDMDSESAHIEIHWSLLGRDERARAGRYRFRRDALRYIVRRGRLRQLLGLRLGCPAAEVALASDRFGKLSVPGSSLFFNLSHSRGIALYAFSRERQVGCDIEWRDARFAREESIAERFFAPREVSLLRSLPPSDRVLGFFACWTRKEAYVKGCGLGLSLPLDSFAVSLAPAEPAAFLEGCDGWSLASFEPVAGYQAAVAVSPEACTGRLTRS